MKNENKPEPPLAREESAEEPVKTPVQIPANELDERIRIVARELFEEMLHNIPNGRNIIGDTQDSASEAKDCQGEGKGRRENRAYIKASVTIDLALWDRLMQEKDRLHESAGRTMDVVLWRYFNRPPMSLELSEAEREVLKKKYLPPSKKK